MFNIFNSNVFVEIGEAIGNVGRKVFRRQRADPETVDQAFRRLLSERLPPLDPSFDNDRIVEPSGEVIEAEYRIMTEHEEEVSNGDGRDS